MDIVTRPEARAAGKTRYYTGKPCKSDIFRSDWFLAISASGASRRRTGVACPSHSLILSMRIMSSLYRASFPVSTGHTTLLPYCSRFLASLITMREPFIASNVTASQPLEVNE